LSDFEPRMDELPALGQHSAQVLLGLGFTEAEIARFASEKLI
jgi:crotonobetainyl-CoA:carnitine CoA-transferase CaiB-like acyl-CoA transferase